MSKGEHSDSWIVKLSCLGVFLFISSMPWVAAAQESQLTGFPGSSAASERALEERFATSLDANNLRAWLQELSKRPHHTGSKGSRQVAESIAKKFSSWGFDTEIETFFALIPTPRDRLVEMVAPHAYKASLAEPTLPGHASEDPAGSLPGYNAFSRDGDVTARAVYVNYGLAEDYELLARRGIDVEGKIVIARYGKAFRGIKSRLAGEMGAVGAILFSDPAEYGSARGLPYPKGPFLPGDGVQRGSVLDLTLRAGDPLTPGQGATSRPDSFSLDQVADVISPVPVLPLSANDARPILAAMTGSVAPSDWQGALPLTYRLGGNVTLRLKVQQNWAIVPLLNVVAKLEGSTWPNEWVLRGNNHDAWNYGALVAGSGLVTMMEEARGIAGLTQTGWRPKRTLVYLAWDGEEQGLMGSTEWAETHADELRDKAVVYLNTGVTTRGFLAAGGSHALESLVDDVARVIDDPNRDVTLRDRALELVRLSGDDDQCQDVEALGRYRLAPLGLGSDFTPFLHHLGIPALDLAFEGEAESGIYHSIYDTFAAYDRFGDPGFVYGVKLAEAGGRILLRLANADVLPFDFRGMSYALTSYANEIAGLADAMRDEKAVPKLDVASLSNACGLLEKSAARFNEARVAFEAAAFEASQGSPNHDDLGRLNALIRRAEQKLAPAVGLPGRPWYRHLAYAPGYATGYGAKTLPGVREAIERRDWKEATSETNRVAAAIRDYAATIDQAAEILERENLKGKRASYGG